jgi:putative membrane-bound dehydrogenase-like protein
MPGKTGSQVKCWYGPGILTNLIFHFRENKDMLPMRDKNKLHLFLLFIFFISTSCGSGDSMNDSARKDSIPEEQTHLPENALYGLVTADNLEVKLMASEPVLRNPTNIDVDDRGRIWVTEAYNYRPGQSSTIIPEGDRIMILEDKDGDGITEVHKVFYQGPEINAPLGICLIGNRVIVSQSPYVWAFYDDNGDDKADRKEVIFQNISGVQHDHGMHTFTSGPDGKLYFNFGNEGKTLRDKNNKIVYDQFGDSISDPKYKQGMVFRCDPDGSNIERLGHNFRNNYEVAVDSYGTMWQSDNDDDGNRGVRINYVMDYGNYGFTDEMTGASWPVRRTNMEDSIPFRHWHLNDPGVVPNLLQTGSGSPTGIAIYEGSLLPSRFQNQMIHCEPGHNVVRAYPVKNDGAGYSAEIENILTGEKDQWFRPSDVCVAPDGSLIVADWYDPVVGGHDAKDKESGRIYRIAPKGSEYKIPQFDYKTPEGAVSALQNPNQVVRRKAWFAIQEMGNKAVPALEELWKKSENKRMRARAFWALVKLPAGEKYISTAIKDEDPDLRIAGLRAARQLNADVMGVVKQLAADKHPQVRRECILALHKNKSPEAAKLWVELARHYDAKDRWYLEALGIGAADQWDRFFDAYINENNDPLKTAAGRDIVWRARTDKSLPYLVKLATDESNDLKSRLRYFRAFDFNRSPAKTNALMEMLEKNMNGNVEVNAAILQGLDQKDIKRSPVAMQALKNVLQSTYGTDTYIELVKKYELKNEKPQLLKLALEKPEDPVAAEAVRLIIQYDGKDLLENAVKGKDRVKAEKSMTAISKVGNRQTLGILQEVALSKKYDDSLRAMATSMIGRTYSGEDAVFNMIKANKLPAHLVPYALKGMEHGPRRSMLIRVQEYLSENSGEKAKTPFDRDSVLSMKGNASRGAVVFETNCSICHQVKDKGVDFGPKLNDIGAKLPKDGLLDAIVNPSAGLSFGYETTELLMKEGTVHKGLLSAKTDTDLELKFPGGTTERFKISDVSKIKKLPESLMPALHEAMSKQDLANLLEYLSTLGKK